MNPKEIADRPGWFVWWAKNIPSTNDCQLNQDTALFYRWRIGMGFYVDDGGHEMLTHVFPIVRPLAPVPNYVEDWGDWYA